MFYLRNQQFDRLLHQLEYLNENVRLVAQVLRDIDLKLGSPPPPPPSLDITSFTITQLGDPMSLLPIAPGNQPQIQATPEPAGAVPVTPPTWTSSDTTNAPITVDPTGLIATVDIPATAVVDTSFTLTVDYSNADGTKATGTFTATIVSVTPPVIDITGFSLAQIV